MHLYCQVHLRNLKCTQKYMFKLKQTANSTTTWKLKHLSLLPETIFILKTKCPIFFNIFQYSASKYMSWLQLK